MKFTTPCFVCIEDAGERKELRQWLSDIGYKNCAGCETHVVAYSNGTALWMEMQGRTNEVFAKEFHNCGTNTPLFRALAAMNDDNDREQWFIVKDACHRSRMFIYGGEDDTLTNGRAGYFARKATAQEIVEHFKAKEK